MQEDEADDRLKAASTEVVHRYSSLNLLHLHFPKLPELSSEKFRNFGNDKTSKIPEFRHPGIAEIAKI